MLKIPGTLPVRTRLPVAAWAVAGVVTLFSLISTLLHMPVPSQHAMPQAEQVTQPQAQFRQAKL
jgi:hypothetical protein